MSEISEHPRPVAGSLEEDATGLPVSGAIVLLFGGFMGNVVFGASALALPEIAADLQLGSGTAGLVVSLFALGFAASLVFGGRLGDRYGRRRLFRIGLAALALASLGVAGSPSDAVLLALRVLQGISAGLMLPQVLSTVQHTTTGRNRTRWLAGYAVAVGMGTVAGQLMAGGLMSARLPVPGWRALFALIFVLCLAGLALTRTIPDTRSAHTTGSDPIGAALFGIGIAAVLLPLALGSDRHWPWWTFAILALAAILIAGFVLWERRTSPSIALVPGVALREPVLIAGLGLTMLFFAGYGAFVYLYSVNAQNGLGFGAFAAALSLTPFGLGFLVTAMISPRIASRFGSVATMRAGAILQLAMLLAMAILVQTTWPDLPQMVLQPVLILLGAAQAVMYTPLIGTVMGSVSHHIAGLASGLFATAQQLATALGVALFGMLYAGLGSNGTAFAGCLLAQGVLGLVFLIFAGRSRGHRVEPSSLRRTGRER